LPIRRAVGVEAGTHANARVIDDTGVRCLQGC